MRSILAAVLLAAAGLNAQSLTETGGDSLALARAVLAESAAAPARLIQAAQSAGMAADTAAFRLLLPLLAYPDPEVRKVAAWAASATGDSAAVRHLLRTARRDPEPGVRRQAVMLLRGYPLPEVLVFLGRTALDTAEQATVRTQAVLALGDAGDERAMWFLEQTSADPDPALRAATAAALAPFWAAGVGDLLIEMLGDEVEEVRVSAAEALAAMGESRSAGEVAVLVRRTGRLLPGRLGPAPVEPSLARRQCRPFVRLLLALAALDPDAAVRAADRTSRWLPDDVKPLLVALMLESEFRLSGQFVERLGREASDPAFRRAASRRRD